MLASPSLSNFPGNLTTPRGLDFSKWEAKLFLCRISSLNIAFLIFFIHLIYFTSKTRITIHTGKCMIFPRTPLPASNFAFYFDALFLVADFGAYLKSWSRKSSISNKNSEIYAATHHNFRIDLLNCARLIFKTEIGFVMWMTYILLPRIALDIRNEKKPSHTRSQQRVGTA